MAYLPCGVISDTSSSTVTFSSPLRRITSLQYSFSSSRHLEDSRV